LRHRPFSSFRRRPESSGIEEEFDVYTITALLVIWILNIRRTNDERSYPKRGEKAGS
jgi:hypothetical protein